MSAPLTCLRDIVPSGDLGIRKAGSSDARFPIPSEEGLILFILDFESTAEWARIERRMAIEDVDTVHLSFHYKRWFAVNG